MSEFLFHIADRVLNRPLLLHPNKAEVILHVLQGRLPLGGQQLLPLTPDANRFLGTQSREDGTWRYSKAQNGVAIIPIIGSLVNRGSWIGANSSGLTSYEGISAQLLDAAEDPTVRSILLDFDSPGGEATGMFSLAEQVRQVGRSKPVTAFVNDMAASAAYGIASAANEIVVSPTSVVGSIGVVLTHMDRSAQMEKAGIKPTLIYAGKHKVDGNPFGPLSETVQADLQAEVLQFYEQFVALVDRGRASMSPESIRSTEARTYIGQESIDRGLADRIATLDQVLAELSATAPAATMRRKGIAMGKTTESAAPQAENAGISPEAHAAAVAAARVEGAAAERTRIGAIIRSEEAEGREPQAMAFAFDTEIGADDAVKLLATASKASAAPVIPSIAARAAQEAEFGGQGQPLKSEADRIEEMRAKSIAKINAQFQNK